MELKDDIIAEVKSLRLNQARIDLLVEQLYDINKTGWEQERRSGFARNESACALTRVAGNCACITTRIIVNRPLTPPCHDAHSPQLIKAHFYAAQSCRSCRERRKTN